MEEYEGTKAEFLEGIQGLTKPCFMRSVNLGLSEYGAYKEKKGNRGGMQYADFVIGGLEGFPDGLRVECKRQDSVGSADEKLNYTVANIERAGVPAWIGWVGDGWKDGAMARTRAQVGKTTSLIGVHHMEVVKEELVKLLHKKS